MPIALVDRFVPGPCMYSAECSGGMWRQAISALGLQIAPQVVGLAPSKTDQNKKNLRRERRGEVS